jgi:DNA-binding MarR family transcriptional regulator
MIIDVASSNLVDTTPSDVTASSDLTERIIADFRATVTELKCASSERLLRLGISMAQLHVMHMVRRYSEITMSHLADVLDVSLSNATGLIDRMHDHGLVERSHIPEDRRVVVVRMTEAGTRTLDEVDTLSDDLLRTVLARLGRSELAGVAMAMADLRTALERTTGPTAGRYPAFTTGPSPQPTVPADGPPGTTTPRRD